MLELTFTVDEVNLILAALGAQPYSQVFQLIAKIHKESNAQLADAGQDDDAQNGDGR